MGILDTPPSVTSKRVPQSGIFPNAKGIAARACWYNGGQTDGTVTGINSRYAHRIVADAFAVRLVYGNFYSNSGTSESTPTNSIVVKASAEVVGAYSAGNGPGTFYPVTFNGRRHVVIAPGGFAISDPIPMPDLVGLSAGTKYFFTRTFAACAAGGEKVPLGLTITNIYNEGVSSSTTEIDLTETGTITTGTGTPGYGPCLILGTAHPKATVEVGLIGDSIINGSGATGLNSFALQALNYVIPHRRLAQPGESAATFAAANNYRSILMTGITDAICCYGTNDVSTGSLDAAAITTIETSLVAVWKIMWLRNIRVFQTTIPPRSTSTDAWATTGNQTTQASNSGRIAINAWIRAGAPVDSTTLLPVAIGTGGSIACPYLTSYFELADTVETARDSGIWKANYTTDGVHPNDTGHTTAAACVTTSSFQAAA